MYKVLLVDDERMILEGISSIMDWEAEGTVLAGTARNGLEALDFIAQDQPDIIISDITMPGLDGMELIEKCMETHPSIKWIFLSGYNEFEYAQKAMRYGVKHYLLKPCNEEDISTALREVVEEIKEQENENLYIRSMESKANTAFSEEKELLFKELLTNKMIAQEKRQYFKEKHLNQQDDQVKVTIFLFHFEEAEELPDLLPVKEMVENELPKNRILAWTLIGNDLIALLKETEKGEDPAFSIKRIQNSYMEGYQQLLTVIISDPTPIKDIYFHYQKMAAYLGERFYEDKGSIIHQKDFFPLGNNDSELYEYNLERLALLLKAGHQEEARKELNQSIEKIKSIRLKPALAKTYLTQLFLTIVKVNSLRNGEEYRQDIYQLDRLESLSEFQEVLEAVLTQTSSVATPQKLKYSSVTVRMIELIQKNLENPDLSLQWIANNAIYMNTNYLGKLFKKETGLKFSTYVMNKRMDRAVEIIEEEGDVKVFELAERLGFGNNPQYFSQLFKRRTGCSPTEIIKAY